MPTSHVRLRARVYDLDAVRMPFDATVALALQFALAVVMFGVALNLHPRDFQELLARPRAPLIGMVCQFLLLPALAFPVAILTAPIPSMALGLMLVAACPGGAVSNFLTQLSRGRLALSVCMSAISTLAAVVTTPLNFMFWGTRHPSTAALMTDVAVEPWALVQTVALLLVFPVTAGMSVARWRPTLAERLRPVFKSVSLLFFALIIVFGFGLNFEMFLNGISMTFIPVAALNAVALGLGWVVSGLAGLDEQERRAVTLEVGIQNSGLAVVITFAYFDGIGGMAGTAAWWGVWHLVAGFTMVALFRLRDRRLTT